MPLLSMRKRRVLLVAIVLMVVLSMLELASRHELITAQLFAIPVVLAAWGAGLRWSIFFGVIATVILFFAPGNSLRVHESALFGFCDAALAFASFCFFAWVGERLRLSQNQLYGLSRRDTLTGIANRADLIDRLKHELERHRRAAKPFTVMFIDCDNFKKINDQQGHAAGDKTLRIYAERLTERLRSVDIVARYGGDEFVVVLTETGLNAAQQVCVDLKARLEWPIEPENIVAGCSIGAVVFDRMPPDADSAIAFADQSMYAGKRRGEGQLNITLYSELP